MLMLKTGLTRLLLKHLVMILIMTLITTLRVKRKIKSYTPTSSSSTKSYSRITLPREPFPCPTCSKKFESKSKLAEHVDDDHERSCTECEDDFSWPDPSHECYFTKYKLRMLAGDIMPAF